MRAYSGGLCLSARIAGRVRPRAHGAGERAARGAAAARAAGGAGGAAGPRARARPPELRPAHAALQGPHARGHRRLPRYVDHSTRRLGDATHVDTSLGCARSTLEMQIC